MSELLIRFLVGGAFVSAFACVGDVLRPKSFAGLFGAAPSIALATLALTISANGSRYAAVESKSMIAGAAAFFAYTICASWLMMKVKFPALRATGVSLLLWLGSALGLWFVWLR